MEKTLVIVESPAKAKTIGKFLGRNYQVKASLGHIRDLPKSQFGVDVEDNFKVKYITIRGKGEILQELRNAANKANKVLLAPDPDREGEAIAWHLLKSLKIDENEKCRIEFNEITKDAIKDAIRHPRKIDIPRVESQQARRVLDRLVGYNLSPLLWRKVKKGLSAGRVQSVAVRLICEREEEIKEFIPEEYWSLLAKLTLPSKKIIEAKLIKKDDKKIEIKNKEQMDQILKDLKGKKFLVNQVKKQKKHRNPAAPFTTSSLQQEAYRKLNFTAKKTMRIAQQLYEGIDIGNEGTVGLVTYIRTDSTRISEVAQEEARKYVLGKFGKNYLPEKPRIFKNKGNTQNAHEAIRPTSIIREPDGLKSFLTRDQYKLYKLIWERFLASQMAQATLEQTTVLIGADNYQFSASGSVIVFKGFMEVYIEGKDEEEELEGPLALVNEGQDLSLAKLEPKQHFTQPPARYTEATLVKTLEEKGIGRPSTYAPTIDTILSRGYVVRENKQFFPTELGFVVIELLKEYFPDIVDVEFTASMENKLDEIEEGNIYWKNVLKEFYTGFEKELRHADQEIGKIEVQEEVSDEACEKCGRNFVVKFGRYGKFLACPGFPECRNTKPLLEEVGVNCPKCKEGQIVIRRSKKGRTFYGCDGYPECDFVSWEKPLNEQCPQCNSFLLEKNTRKGKRKVCSNKDCHYEVKANKGE
ncbi:MAG: topoisomerase [Clostridia bacterium]|nr:topoisomerase [Clostridia bacterium]MDN5322918.1 topoisomerase [Clostridia bacterium]